MISGCSRQSNRSLVVIVARLDSRDVPAAWSHSPLWLELGLQSGVAWWSLTVDVGSVLTVQPSANSSAQFLWDLTSSSFVVPDLVSGEFFCWQRTGMRCGPKGMLKGEQSFNGSLFFLICPVESRFPGRVSLRSSLRLMWQTFVCLWAQALTARFTYCMLSSWNVTLSCKNTTHTHRDV